MAVRQGFETLNYNPTSVEQLLVPVQMKANIDSAFGTALGKVKDTGDYLSPAEEETKLEYKTKIGDKVKDLGDRLLNNTGVTSQDIASLRDVMNERETFFSQGGLGYQRMMEKKAYQDKAKQIQDYKGLTGESKSDYIRLMNLNYKDRYKNGYMFEDISPSEEVDLNKRALDIASKIEKQTISNDKPMSREGSAAWLRANGIPEDSALINQLSESTIRDPNVIERVVRAALNSDPEVQASLAQQDRLRAVNPNRKSSSDMFNNAINIAKEASSVINTKNKTSVDFLPKHVYDGEGGKGKSNDDFTVAVDNYVNMKQDRKRTAYKQVESAVLKGDPSRIKDYNEYSSDKLSKFKEKLGSKTIFNEPEYVYRSIGGYSPGGGSGGFTKYKNPKYAEQEKLKKGIVDGDTNSMKKVQDDLISSLNLSEAAAKQVLAEARKLGGDITKSPSLNKFILGEYELSGVTSQANIPIATDSKDSSEFLTKNLGSQLTTVNTTVYTSDDKGILEEEEETIDMGKLINEKGLKSVSFNPSNNTLLITRYDDDKGSKHYSIKLSKGQLKNISNRYIDLTSDNELFVSEGKEYKTTGKKTIDGFNDVVRVVNGVEENISDDQIIHVNSAVSKENAYRLHDKYLK